ncbi:MAG: hypothetical protein J7513_04120 [Solirubrobacteraceae bacterium]|nr:hypothetical protein [Solirubrobacteraceae bacterium]
MTDPRTSSQAPWWAEVEHLRTSPETGRHQAVPASRRADRHPQPSAGRQRPTPQPAARRRSSSEWFEQEARTAGRHTTPAPERRPERPARPRATLVDVAPAHALVRRAPQTRRRAGERPTVTITGRPDAALPPRPTHEPVVRAARARERASAVVASPDRLILWAVALGLLMILASVATGSAGA